MKKRIIIITLISTFYVTLMYSQFSARIGANWSDAALNFADDSHIKNKFGFHFGIMTDLNIKQNFSFRPGILFSQRGYRINEGDENFKLNINYLDIPLTFTYSFLPKKKGLFVEAGPNILYLLGARQTSNGVNQNFNGFINNIDIGLVGGVGYRISYNLGLGINCNYGLRNLPKGAEGDDTITNRNISCYFFYAL